MRLYGILFTAVIHGTFALPAEVVDSAHIIPSEANVQVETDPAGVTWPWLVYKSSPHTPPNMTITGNGKPLADGYIFMTPQTTNISRPYTKENAGFIRTSDGDLVFALNVTGLNDFRKQCYDGKPYLTYWNGYNTMGTNVGHGYGQANFLDDTYSSFAVDPNLHLTKLTKTPVANWSIDIHEQQMTDQNTLLVTAYNNTEYDLTPVGGSAHGWLVDGLVFELDIATEEVLFSWRATDHLPLKASHQPVVSEAGNGTKAAPWDWFHINAIEKIGENYLVNSRHHWATYFVSGKDGSIIWSIEGESGGSFGALPTDGTFRWQHHARAHNVTKTSLDLSLFDNHNSLINNGTAASRGLVYHLEFPAKKSYKPKLLRRIETPSDEIYADSQGSYEPELSNGNQLVGYGQIAITREYGPGSQGTYLRWQAQFGGINKVQSYRAFKETWRATPTAWDPKLVVEGWKAYISWNGATDISGWAVYTGKKKNGLTRVGVAAKKGFETVFAVPSGTKYLQVAALEGGKEVRKSNIVSTAS